jgi:hypothetical protein
MRRIANGQSPDGYGYNGRTRQDVETDFAGHIRNEINAPYDAGLR